MAEREIPLTEETKTISATISRKALPGLLGALSGKRASLMPTQRIAKQLLIALVPALVWVTAMGLVYRSVTEPIEIVDTSGLVEMGATSAPAETAHDEAPVGGVQEPPVAEGLQEPPAEGLQEPPAEGLQEPPKEVEAVPLATVEAPAAQEKIAEVKETAQPRAAPTAYWITLGIGTTLLVLFYGLFTFARLELFKMLLSSFFPLAVMILAVLGSIVFGLATPTEAAAVGGLGGLILAAAYRQLNFRVVKESTFLTAKTAAMVCWLFVGSSIFSAAFALLGGQDLIEKWVLSLNMTPVQFLLLSQFIIFILGWPLEWTEIIVIFMPIFIPLLAHFNVDPLFFGLLVALNLQTAFLSPPVAMAAFYLKGVSPPHVTLNQIFAGMLPFMAIQVLAMFLLYMWPAIGMWLPSVLYK